MSAESPTSAPSPSVRPGSVFRLDPTRSANPAAGAGDPWSSRGLRLALLLAAAGGFVLYGGGTLDLGPAEARVALSAGEKLGPVGRAFSGWEPSVWPLPAAAGRLWAWGAGAWPSAGSVRWPAAIAGVLAGLVLASGVARTLGGRAALLAGLAWYASLGLIDHSSGLGLDLLTGAATVAAFARLLGRGSDLVAGAWAAVAFLAGGWPPLALLGLATVVLGRHGATLSWRFLLPPALTFAAWFGWTVKVAPAEVWASALTLPLTQRPAFLLVPEVLIAGLPWSPLVLLAAGRTVRGGWEPAGRSHVVGWLQVAGVCLLAGTLIPGLAAAARVPALAGLAVAAGASVDRVLAGAGAKATRGFLLTVAGLTLFAILVTVGIGGYLAAAVSYYRPLAVGMMAACAPLLLLAGWSVIRRDTRAGVATLLILCGGLKLAHWGYYVPEWNYRFSQGPWGRAVAQWVPPGWPVYTTHAWPADLALAIGRPVRQLPSERHLEFVPGVVRFVLLLDTEFEHWPPQAPALVPVARFQDEATRVRVLARTPGDLPWEAAARVRRGADEE